MYDSVGDQMAIPKTEIAPFWLLVKPKHIFVFPPQGQKYMAFLKVTSFGNFFSLHYEHAVFQIISLQMSTAMKCFYIILPLTDAQFQPDSKLVLET